jgi:ABC-type nitrate/sulfonate/bicarbonate transport system substrate-binding protein
LLAGAIDATPLLPPTSFSAASQGYPILDDSRKYFPNFPTSGYTANVPWATAHRPLLVAFIKSVLEGVQWLYDPKNKTRALQILEEATNTAPGDAERTYEQYTRQHLFSTSGRYDVADFPAVVEMLVQTKQITAGPPAGTKIYDGSFAEEAGRRLVERR